MNKKESDRRLIWVLWTIIVLLIIFVVALVQGEMLFSAVRKLDYAKSGRWSEFEWRAVDAAVREYELTQLDIEERDRLAVMLSIRRDVENPRDLATFSCAMKHLFPSYSIN